MKNFFTYNLWLKIISLILAFFTWMYINKELIK